MKQKYKYPDSIQVKPEELSQHDFYVVHSNDILSYEILECNKCGLIVSKTSPSIDYKISVSPFLSKGKVIDSYKNCN